MFLCLLKERGIYACKWLSSFDENMKHESFFFHSPQPKAEHIPHQSSFFTSQSSIAVVSVNNHIHGVGGRITGEEKLVNQLQAIM